MGSRRSLGRGHARDSRANRGSEGRVNEAGEFPGRICKLNLGKQSTWCIVDWDNNNPAGVG